MFQLEKRVNSITVNDAEREEFNELLVQAQELTGVIHTSIKDSYKHLLVELIARCRQTESTVQSEAKKTEEAESTVQSNESTVNSDEIEKLVSERTQQLSNECTEKSETIERLENENDLLAQQILTLNDALETAVGDQEVIEIEVEKPFTPGPNDVYLPLDDNHAVVLRTIAENRAKRLKIEPKSISEIVKEIVFNRAILYNWHGEYWTGLK